MFLYTCIATTGSPSVTSLVFDRELFRLTCISTAGPATTVTWMKNGAVVEVDGTTYQLEQRVTNYERASYENVLTIRSPNITDYISLLSCNVTNSRGASSSTVTLQGTVP